MARDENDDILPDQDAAKEFYAKYEPKEVLGRCVYSLLEMQVLPAVGFEWIMLTFYDIFIEELAQR